MAQTGGGKVPGLGEGVGEVGSCRGNFGFEDSVGNEVGTHGHGVSLGLGLSTTRFCCEFCCGGSHTGV